MARAAEGSAADLAAAALADLTERWRRGERVWAEAYLERLPALRSSTECVLDLIYGEILVREELGEAPEVAEYIRRFPQHEPALRRQFNIHRAIRSQLVTTGDKGSLPPTLDPSAQPLGGTLSVGDVTSAGTRFHILRPHARGGLGEVFVAEDTELHREVALKEIQGRHADNPSSRARFLLEAEITGGLEHPGIVPVYGLGQYADGRPYYAMRFIKGESLRKAIERFHDAKTASRDASERSVEFRKLLSRFVEVCNAVAYAHSRGVLHRDLKPDNIMLGKFGETLVVDWGLAKAQGRQDSNVGAESLPLVPPSASGSAETVAGSAIGTPQYMSPEQAAGRLDQLGPTSDVYSLGATLYTLLTGRPAVVDSDLRRLLKKVQEGDIPPPRQIQRQIPRALEAVCLKAMALKPEDRYPTARALADDVEHWLADEPVAALVEPFSVRAGRWARRHRTLVTATAAALMVAVVGLVAATLLLGEANQRERTAKKRAEKNAAEAKEQSVKARENAAEAHKQSERALRQLALSYLDQGVVDWDAGRHPLAVFELYQAYRTAPPGSALRAGALRLLGDRCRHLEILLPHDRSVNAVAYSPDGKTVLTGSTDNTARIWDAATGKPVTPALVHDGFVKAVAFAPDGKAVLTGSVDKTARLWNAATGHPLAVLRHEGSVDAVAFSPDGKTVLTGCDDDTAWLWDVATGKPLCESLRHAPGRGAGRGIRAVAFHPSGKSVLTAGADNAARLWDAVTGKPLTAPLRHGGAVDAAAFSPDGQTILTGSGDNAARLWDTSGKLRATLRHEGNPRPRGVRSVAFSPDGKTVLTGSLDTTAQLWDAGTGAPLTKTPLSHTAVVLCVAFRPDNQAVLTSCGDGTVRLWDVASGMPLGAPLRHERSVTAAVFSPDSKKVLTGGQDYTARVWDLAVDDPPPLLTLPHQSTVTATFSRDGKTVLSGSGDKTALLWDAATGKRLFEFRHADYVDALAYSPDSKTLLTASWDGTARLWSATTGQPLASLQHEDIVLAAIFSPDGKTVLTGSEDKTARLWDVATGKPKTLPLRHEHFVRAVAFSPDGKIAATCCADMTARVWDVASGKPLTEPLVHGVKHTPNLISVREAVVLQSVAFSPDGKRLLTACADLNARLWDVATGKPVGPPLRHDGAVTLAIFSPDGKSILTGSGDHTARLWDAATGKLLTAPLRHQNDVVAVAFSPDSRTVLTGSWDRTAQLWDTATGKPLGPPLRHNDRLTKGAVAFGPDGKAVLTGSIDKMVRLWRLPDADLPDDPDLLESLIAVRAKLRLTPDGLILPLALSDWQAARHKLEQRGWTPR
jgi:WD40 repeat protein/tRNA A-37 threonylcarbamoyl transferase component Bud32